MKIGFISMPLAGHLNPMTALARKLQYRGTGNRLHRGSRCRPHSPGRRSKFRLLLRRGVPGRNMRQGSQLSLPGSMAWKQHAGRYGARQSLLSGSVAAPTARTCRNRRRGAGARHHSHVPRGCPDQPGIPYAHVWAILNIDFSGTTLPSVVPGRYENTPEARGRNIEDLQKSDNAFFGLVQPLAEGYAERNGLKLDWSNPRATVSRRAAVVVSQTLKEFDFPGIPWPSQFH